MKHALSSLAIVVTLAAAAAVAEAAVKTGTYDGKIRNRPSCIAPAFESPCPNGSIALTVKRKASGAKHITSLTWSSLHMRCTDDGDGEPANDQLITMRQAVTGSVTIHRDGKFNALASFANGARTVSFIGAFSTSKATVTGVFREIRTYNEDDRLDRTGSVRCDSGRARVSAKVAS